MTLEEFLELPEEKPALEYEPDGTITQKMSPKGQHSTLQGAFVELINRFGRRRRLAYAFTELRTIFGGAAYVPDVAVYRWERIPRDHTGKVLNDFVEPPDIAIEVVAPEQSVSSLRRKCTWYVENGVEMALIVDPDHEWVVVFRKGQIPKRCVGRDQIDLSEVLPGFELTADQVFGWLRIE
jgi:Uma2 family endonuclease